MLINIIGGVCLLLWGLRNVKTGVNRAFGAGLHKIIANSTSNRIKAFFTGIGVTALLQSSTATTLILAGFCSRGIITTAGGIAIILGADVGTTLVAQVLSFDLSWLSPMLLIAGFFMVSRFETAGRVGHLGRICFGLGLMLLALSLIKQTTLPLKESELIVEIMKSLGGDTIFAIFIAAIMTWLAHSSLAVVLLLMSFVQGDIIPLDVGLAMVLGANLGGVLAPIVATINDNESARRVPLGNFIVRLIGVSAAIPFLGLAQEYLLVFDSNSARVLVNFHTGFNVVLALFFLPLTGLVANLSTIMLPDKDDPDDPSRPKYLDEKSLDVPTIALASASRETLRMADILDSMLGDTLKAFTTNDIRWIRRVKSQDDILDDIFKTLKLYMARLSQSSLDPEEAIEYEKIISFATNMEHAGDVIDKGLMAMAEKKLRKQKNFSDEGLKEIENIHYLVNESVRLAQTIFVSDDLILARQMIEGKERLRSAEQEANSSHLDRLREGVPETISTSSMHIDIIRDYRRINTHMCTVAYPILEESGQIRSTRLKPLKKPS
jgi:phosphate:Na+ symporter